MKHTDDPVISVTPVRVVGVYDVGSVSKSSNLITVHGKYQCEMLLTCGHLCLKRVNDL